MTKTELEQLIEQENQMEQQRCTMCGKVIDTEPCIFEGRAGYGSIFDGADYRLQLCPDCLDNIFVRCFGNPISKTNSEESPFYLFQAGKMAIRDGWKELQQVILSCRRESGKYYPDMILAVNYGGTDEDEIQNGIKVTEITSSNNAILSGDDEFPSLFFVWNDATIELSTVFSIQVCEIKPEDDGEVVYRAEIETAGETYLLYVRPGTDII